MPTIGEMLAGAAPKPRQSPLACVLPAVFSAGDKLKRMASDFAADPIGNIQQKLGFLNDQAGQFNQLHSQATQEAVSSIKGGGSGFGPASQQLAGKLADAYNPVGMFVGVGAKTADKAMLSKAQQMLDAGADNRDVWAQTGWFRGPDGKMRFEIDDSNSGMRLLQPKFGSDASTQKLNEAFDHPALLNAHPDLKSINVNYSDVANGGSYSSPRDWAEYIDVPRAAGGGAKATPEISKSTMLHELQHAIQKREGFASGGNPESSYGLDIADALKAVRKDKAAIGIDPYAIQNRLAARYKVPDEDLAKLKEWQVLTAKEDGLLKSMASPYEAYRRIAGEAEARAVQERMNLTAEQRRALFPLDSYDVPIDSLIFK